GPAHRLARLRLLERVVGRALGDPERLCRNAGPRAVEDPHRELEAVTLRAEEARGRDAHVVERQLTGGRAADPELRLEPSDGEARGVRLDEEGGDPGVAGVR